MISAWWLLLVPLAGAAGAAGVFVWLAGVLPPLRY